MDDIAYQEINDKIKNQIRKIPGISPDTLTTLDAGECPGYNGYGLFIEQSGVQVGELSNTYRLLRNCLNPILKNIRYRIEIVRPGWLPRNADGDHCRLLLQQKLTAREKYRGSTEAIYEQHWKNNIHEQDIDLFSAWGHASRIRTPVEIQKPNRISIGSWVSLGRCGKILLLDDFSETPQFVSQHYPGEEVSVRATPYSKRSPSVHIGDGTSLGDYFFIAATCRIEIGKHVVTSQRLFLTDCAHVFDDPKLPITLQGNTDGQPLIIEDGCWIGINVSILRGVRIGKHSVIGAGSVVIHDVPPYAVVAGAPARIIRYQTPQSSGSVRRPGIPGQAALAQMIRHFFEREAGHAIDLGEDLVALGLISIPVLNELYEYLQHQQPYTIIDAGRSIFPAETLTIDKLAATLHEQLARKIYETN